MPKAIPTKRPISCLFGLNKPTGKVTMSLLNEIQPLMASSTLFKDPNRKGRQAKKVKMGQGGTLDPLADGVLVIATNSATKQLTKYLDSTKEYRAIGMFGCVTDSYDAEGKVVKYTQSRSVTKKAVEDVLARFRGDITQYPPIYSALKMDGKPLYEYARSGTPLPRPIEGRKATIHSLELVDFREHHEYTYPEKKVSQEENDTFVTMEEYIRDKNSELASTTAAIDAPEQETPPIFEIKLTVSSGTYVRTVIHDIGQAVGSSAFVVKLTRTRQGEFYKFPEDKERDAQLILAGDKPKEYEELFGCVEWETLQVAAQKYKENPKLDTNGNELQAWEQEILDKCKLV